MIVLLCLRLNKSENMSGKARCLCQGVDRVQSSFSAQPVSNHFSLVWFGFSKCAKRLPCVGNFHKTSFHSIVITSKWQLCWEVKCFISLYFHINRMKYEFVNSEVEEQVGSRRGKENWRCLSVSYRIQKGFPIFCYPVPQRVTLKKKTFCHANILI